MQSMEPFSITIEMFGIYSPFNMDGYFPPIAALFIQYSFSLTLLIALIALLMPNRLYPMRHIILISSAFIAIPSLTLNAMLSFWVYACMKEFVLFSAFALVILLTLGLFFLSRRYEKTSQIHAFLRILSVWFPLPFVMFLVELISYLIGYQICVA